MNVVPRTRRGSRGSATAAFLLFLILACGGGNDESLDDPADLLRVETEARALVASTPLIVTAEVSGIKPGRTSEGLAFEDVHLDVLRTLGGTAPDELIVEQADPGGRTVGPGRFEPGGRYLLLLRPSRTEQGRYVPVPQGRYRLVGDRLEAIDPGPVADTWHGKEIEQVERQIRELSATVPP